MFKKYRFFPAAAILIYAIVFNKLCMLILVFFVWKWQKNNVNMNCIKNSNILNSHLLQCISLLRFVSHASNHYLRRLLFEYGRKEWIKCDHRLPTKKMPQKNDSERQILWTSKIQFFTFHSILCRVNVLFSQVKNLPIPFINCLL